MCEKIINIKENKIKEISEKLTQINEIVDSFESIADEKIEALEIKMIVQNKKFTEQCVKVLAVKVDEICLGLGSHEIEEEIMDFFLLRKSMRLRIKLMIRKNL